MGMAISCFSNMMYLSEKMVLCVTCVLLISCIVLMFVITLGMGIGLGYNYCFVDLKTKYKRVPSHIIYPGHPRWPKTAGLREEDTEMLTETDNPIDAQLRENPSIDFPPDELPRKTFDDSAGNSSINGTSINNDTVHDLVEKLGLSDNDTHVEYEDDDEEETTTSNVTTTDVTLIPTTASKAATEYVPDNEPVKEVEMEPVVEPEIKTGRRHEMGSELWITSQITSEISSQTVPESTTEYKSTYRYFDEVEKSAEIHDFNDPAERRKVHDPYSDDVTEPPVVDIDVDSPDVSGGKRVKKVVIPISGLDLISLLSKLKTENRNYSLQIVTT